MSNATPLFSDVVSPIPFEHSSPAARLLCVKCHGEGQQYRQEPFMRFTWPEFKPTPKGKTWHVERNGKIVKTGTGLSACASWDEERASGAVSALVDKIEAAAIGNTQHSIPSLSRDATRNTVTIITDNGYQVEHDRDWTWARFADKPPAPIREALKDNFGARWSRRRQAWYIREHVEADAIAQVIGSTSALAAASR